jgi:hypothetical protein
MQQVRSYYILYLGIQFVSTIGGTIIISNIFVYQCTVNQPRHLVPWYHFAFDDLAAVAGRPNRVGQVGKETLMYYERPNGRG